MPKGDRRRSSHLSLEEQDNLERRLQARPDPERLTETGVLHSDVTQSARLHSAKAKLEHTMARDTVGHLLEARRDPEDLINQGVMRPKRFSVSSSIQGVQDKLERTMKSNKVGHLLEQRSELDDLVARDLVRDPHVAPALQSKQRDLARNLAKSNLYHALQHRPSIVELMETGVYVPSGEYGYDEQEEDDEDYSGQDSDYDYDEQQPGYSEAYQAPANVLGSQRSRLFQLTRLLLKTVAALARENIITETQKGALKDMIVDADDVIISCAEQFANDEDFEAFQEALVNLTYQ